MSKLLFITFLFIGFASLGQNVTLNDLLTLRKSNTIEVEEFLTSKNWDLFKIENPTSEFMGTLTFAYEVSNYDKSKAQSFINYFYNFSGSSNILSIQSSLKDKYLYFLNEVKKFNPKLIFSDVKNVPSNYENDKINWGYSEIIKVYQGKTTTFEFVIKKEDRKEELYILRLYENSDYNNNY